MLLNLFFKKNNSLKNICRLRYTKELFFNLYNLSSFRLLQSVYTRKSALF